MRRSWQQQTSPTSTHKLIRSRKLIHLSKNLPKKGIKKKKYKRKKEIKRKMEQVLIRMWESKAPTSREDRNRE